MYIYIVCVHIRLRCDMLWWHVYMFLSSTLSILYGVSWRLDDLRRSARGSILPRRPCAWLAPCHRTTGSTSMGPRAATAARCGRSCLNDYCLRWLKDEGIYHPKKTKRKNWSHFSTGKSASPFRFKISSNIEPKTMDREGNVIPSSNMT